ncbi:hypothetical protein OPT61_g9062 [Boeremia exigua]|uniref:Uncharacterized protein n=1 Tax=Boeremia exigua TaxID=749465 RepID=A0ACC2HVN4_9PLEO|nr:hypothetical protein OPT61_g9062 [Boeremia exigua]
MRKRNQRILNLILEQLLRIHRQRPCGENIRKPVAKPQIQHQHLVQLLEGVQVLAGSRGGLVHGVEGQVGEGEEVPRFAVGDALGEGAEEEFLLGVAGAAGG